MSRSLITAFSLILVLAGCESVGRMEDQEAEDRDQDTIPVGLDCDDQDPEVHPGATEICRDGIDNDCVDGDAPCGLCPNGAVDARCVCGTGLVETGYCCDTVAQGTPCPIPPPNCGNGAPDDGEACDTGTQNGQPCSPAYGSSCQYCGSICTQVTLQGPRCGDSSTDTAQEECDEGASNGNPCSPPAGGSCTYCSTACQWVTVEDVPVNSDVFTWGFDRPWSETLEGNYTDLYDNRFSSDIWYLTNCLSHSSSLGRTGPAGALRVQLDSDHAPMPPSPRAANVRCELYRKPWHDDSEGPGTEKWIGFSVYISDEWVPDTASMEGICQIHAGNETPNFLTTMEGSKMRLHHKVGSCGTDGDWTNTIYDLVTVSKGNWYDLVYQIVGATSTNASDGIFRVWVNGVQKVNEEGQQNLYDCSPYVGSLKLGVYKWEWKDAGIVANSVAAGAALRVYHFDNISIYLGSDGYELVDPSRSLPADPQ